MSLGTTIDKVIEVISLAIIGAPGSEDHTLCKGVYDNDQIAFSEYPVIIVGVPSLLDETFPVIAEHAARDEEYTIEVVAYVLFADTAANTRQIITLTDSIRAAIRADMKPPNIPLSGYCYQAEINDSKFFHGSKYGEILLRVSVTIFKYIKRIVV